MKATTRIGWTAAISTAMALWLIAHFVLPGLPLGTVAVLWLIVTPIVYRGAVKQAAAEREILK